MIQSATMNFLSGLIVLLAIALVGVILQTFGVIEFEVISKLSGLANSNDVLKILGFAIGGLVLMLQALIANKRAKAMEGTAKAQVDANRKTEQGQRQERLKNAIEHLGNKSESVRLGGAYELFHLANDTEHLEKDTELLQQTALDILCAHIRRTTRDEQYQVAHPSQPSEEIQSLLTACRT